MPYGLRSPLLFCVSSVLFLRPSRDCHGCSKNGGMALGYICVFSTLSSVSHVLRHLLQQNSSMILVAWITFMFCEVLTFCRAQCLPTSRSWVQGCDSQDPGSRVPWVHFQVHQRSELKAKMDYYGLPKHLLPIAKPAFKYAFASFSNQGPPNPLPIAFTGSPQKGGAIC